MTYQRSVFKRYNSGKNYSEFVPTKKGKGSPYSITESRVPELIPALDSQPAGNVNH